MMGKFIDLTGQKFGRLTVIKYHGKNKHGQSIWICKCGCGCGEERIIPTYALRGGIWKSCGCLRKEKAAEHCRKDLSTHNMCYSRLYSIWHGMKQRCLNTNDKNYPNYGGRRITVCDGWANEFEGFMNWALLSGYTDKLTIDRKNNDGNYEPQNCRWATIKDQANNRRSSRIITYKGISHTASEWANSLCINYATFESRRYAGWTIDKIINTPVEMRK